MVCYRKWTGTKFGTIVKFTWIDQTQSRLRNRINFVFFALLALAWWWAKEKATCTYLGNLKGSIGLILVKTSAMRILIPFDQSSRPFIPLPRFIRSRRPIPVGIGRWDNWHRYWPIIYNTKEYIYSEGLVRLLQLSPDIPEDTEG
jgi:hypothetical protein